jgi:hypothetical protein
MNTKMLILLLSVSAPVFAATVALDGTWYTGAANAGGTPSLSDPNSSSFVWGTDGSATQTAQRGVLWSYFFPQSLANDGKTITLSFTVTPLDATASAQSFRFGLFNSGGTQVLHNLVGVNTDNGFLDTVGYFSVWNQGTSANATLYSQAAGTNNPVSSTASGAAVIYTDATGSVTLAQGTAYDMTLMITRYSATQYSVTSSINDANSISAMTTTINATSFDTVAIMNTPTGIDSMEFTNLTITTGTAQYPLITVQPEHSAVDGGESASFTVAATNPLTGDTSGMTYQWYRGLPGDTSTPVSGATSATYTIDSVAAADEGSYYCIVTLTATTETSESQAATLSIKRLLAHYTFDGDPNDFAGTNDGTPINGGPDYVAGEINQAAKFYAGRYVDIGTNAYPNIAEGLDTGTIFFWLNSLTSTTDTIMGSTNTGTSQMLSIQFATNLRLRFSLRDQNGTFRQVDVDDTTLRDGQWHFVAFVYSTGPETSVAAYIDGEPRDVSIVSPNSGNPQTFTDWEFPLWIGMLNNRGAASGPYNGMLDDLRVYNYELSAMEIAAIYTDARPDESICVVPPESDFDNDCRVTIADLSYIAGQWLDCGLVPTCLP